MHIYPRPKHVEESKQEYLFPSKMCLTVGKGAVTAEQITLFKELYRNFTCGVGRLRVCRTEESSGCAVLSTGKVQCTPKRIEGEYRIEVSQTQVRMYFSDNRSFAHAFSTLLSLVEVRRVQNVLCFTLPVCTIEDTPSVAWRGIHFCVFPETRYNMLKKFIRFAGFVKYTHIIIEFWGTYRYECCKAMARKNAYSYKQVQELVREARAFGMEIIPMINCLGHAAQNRSIYGKHAVLDNDPSLAPLFEPDGWTWNLKNPDTRTLLKQMRKELMEVCGEGKYFHVGCDEAFTYGSSRLFQGEDKIEVLIEYINEVAKEMRDCGRRLMIWGDQLLYPQADWEPVPTNIAYAESQESSDRLLSGLEKDILIVDWEYYAKENPMPTSKLLREKGFEVIIASFESIRGTKVCVQNAVEYNYYGLLQTTWDRMSGGHPDDIRRIQYSAEMFWNGRVEYTKMDEEFMTYQTATYYRKLLPPKGKYKDCGIREREITT